MTSVSVVCNGMENDYHDEKSITENLYFNVELSDTYFLLTVQIERLFDVISYEASRSKLRQIVWVQTWSRVSFAFLSLTHTRGFTGFHDSRF